jgi:hypothetical protein
MPKAADGGSGIRTEKKQGTKPCCQKKENKS